MGIFTKATVIDDSMCYQDDKQWDHEGFIPNTNLKIIKTPGHDQFHSSLIVPTKEGNIIVAGDVFWWSDDEVQKTDTKSLLNHTDPFEKNHQQLIDSRQQLLKIADWIIPGHGKMFKVEK
jgi:glyoxylase-like metal-dependent hydrolase (beta-lactamase superfamily II)